MSVENGPQLIVPAKSEPYYWSRELAWKIIESAEFHPRGQENLEIMKQTPVIFPFAPHCGHLDTAIVLKAFPEKFRPKLTLLAAGDYWFNNPFKYFVAIGMGKIYKLPRKKYTLELFRKVFYKEIPELLNKGESVLFSPEGTRSNPDTPFAERKFKKGLGALMIATEGQYPVIPIRIFGAEYLFPKKNWFPNFKLAKKAHIEVVFDDPAPYDPAKSWQGITQEVQNRMVNLQPSAYLVLTSRDLS